MSSIENLIKILKKQNDNGRLRPVLPYFKKQKPEYDYDLIRLAYDFAKEAHQGQQRKSGEPYINHPLEVATMLAKMGMDQATIIAALLHDVPEDTDYSLVDIEKNFGSEVEKLVRGITKLGVIKYRGIEVQAENLRKMFVSMAEDIRIILIKMVDRLHNLKTLDALPPEKQKRIAQESLEIYAPIANRLGMGEFKGQIEDLAFLYIYPKEYEWLQKEILPFVESRKEFIQGLIKETKEILTKEKIKVLSIRGRVKRMYSLYKKITKPEYDGDISKIFDSVALRVIVPTVSDCYNVLGILHKRWRPLPGRIKDYISHPKPNGYQSLHTTVFSSQGKIVEFQIRTPEMHKQAEYGVAAHWQYKELEKNRWRFRANPRGQQLPKKLQWIDDLVEWQKGIQDNKQYLSSLAIDFFKDRIFVFTPKGDVIDLPEDATIIDFAYHVHTWIGDHCSGARVNDHIASLDTKLKNGDVVQIITDKNRKGPSQDWLSYVKTGAAKNKIKNWKKSNH